MLVQFSFNNYKCFSDETVLSMVAAKLPEMDYYTLPTSQRFNVMKAAAVYGANGSGKSKLFDALRFMQQIVSPPTRDAKTLIADYWLTQYDHFRLNTKSERETSSFEVIFLLNDVQYRYGLEVNSERIVSEWLYYKQKREACVFERDYDELDKINVGQLSSPIVHNLLRANMLSSTTPFISLLNTFNDPLSLRIVKWFKSIKIVSANEMMPTETLNCLNKKNPVVDLMRAFDFNIEGIKLHEMSNDELPEKIAKMINLPDGAKLIDSVMISHKKYNENYEPVEMTAFEMEKDESYGTYRLFSLIGPIFNALQNGTLLLIDEVDSGLHTNIIRFIISLFYANNKNAQLIFNSQNTSLMDVKDIRDEHKLLRKDQLYVTAKNRYGESSLSSFVDYRLRSNTGSIYLDGMLGGVPNLDINSFMEILNQKSNGQ